MDPSPARAHPGGIWFGLLLLAAFNFIAYRPAFQVGFVFDDQVNIFLIPEHEQARQGPLSLWSAFRPSLEARRPLAGFSFALNRRWFGSGPRSFHAVNWAIHLLNAVLVFSLIRAVAVIGRVGSRGGTPPGWGPALAGALLWSLHPVQTQAVTYIVQRMTEVATLFYLLALLLWLQARRPQSRPAQAGWFLLALASAGLGLLAKESLFTWPLAVVLLELLVGEAGRPLRERRPALLKAAAVVAGYAGLVLALALRSSLNWDLNENLSQLSGEWDARLLSQPGAIWHYLSLLAFPHPARLCLDPEWTLAQSLFQPWTTAPAWLGLLLLLAVSLARFRSQPILALPVGFFLLTLLPESIVPSDPIFEHRLYLPTVGLLGFVGALWVWPGKRRQARRLCFAAAVGFLTFLTSARNSQWTDEERLWRDTVRKAPGKARPWNNLAVVENHRGRFGPALHSLQTAARLDPRDFLTWVNLSQFLRQQGRVAEARRAAERAMAAEPNDRLVILNLARAETAAGNLEEALRWYGLILQRQIEDPDFLEKVGAGLNQLQRPDLAVAPLGQAGEIYLRQGRRAEARRVLEQALQLSPQDPTLQQRLEQARSGP